MLRVMDVTKEIVGQNRFQWPLTDDIAVSELQLTLCRHSAKSNGYDEKIYGASACNCETDHFVVGSKGCRSFPLAYSGAIDRRL